MRCFVHSEPMRIKSRHGGDGLLYCTACQAYYVAHEGQLVRIGLPWPTEVQEYRRRLIRESIEHRGNQGSQCPIHGHNMALEIVAGEVGRRAYRCTPCGAFWFELERDVLILLGVG